MRIDQRNAGASVTPTAAVTYILDRWELAASQSSKLSVRQNAGSVTPPTGFTNYLGLTSLSAYSLLSGDFFRIDQPVEGFNLADFGWGTASAVAVTLSFWVRSSLTGSFGIQFTNAAANRVYPVNYTINAANTWEQKTIIIPGDTTGTWETGNATGVRVGFSLGYGSGSAGTGGAWNSGTVNSVTGATSVVGTNGATFYITGVQLEPGTVATPFERRSYGQELALCQRYYTSYSGSGSLYNFFTTQNGSGDTNRYSNAQLPVEMRAAATATVTASAGSASVTGTTTRMIAFSGTSGGTATGVQISAWTASAEL